MAVANSKEYTERAASLRAQGRLEEAVIAARRATEIDAKEPEGWWQLALSLGAKDGGEAARSALLRVTALAPYFAGGWCELGRSLQEAGRLDDAIAKYELALEANDEHVLSRRLLARALKGSKESGTKQRRLDLLRSLWENDTLNEAELFDLAYLLYDAKEYSQAARAYEVYTRDYEGTASFFNLGLTYKNLGRDADALDAFNTARRNGYETQGPLDKMTTEVRNHLRTVRERVVNKSQPELASEDWYRNYVNPFELLNVEDPEELENNPKALQRARQALLREIELEDGKVAWMPGLALDKSRAMSRLEELNDPAVWDAHRLVFDDPALNAFLSRGHLEHFMLNEATRPNLVLPHLVSPDVLQALGAAFAAQYSLVLTRAVEQGNLAAVECLLDGRRWVLPDQEERCFEGAARVLERLSAPLTALVPEAKKRAIGHKEVKDTLLQGNLYLLLTHLPVQFHQAHAAVGYALRELSVSYFNHTNEADEAKKILNLGKVSAEKSPALMHQLQLDEKQLDAFIAEEKSKEAHLVFGQKAADITRAGVSFGDCKLSPTDIIGMRSGMVRTSMSPPTVRYTIAFQGRRGAEVVISWTTSQNLDAQQKHFSALNDAAFTFLADGVISEFQRRLDAGETLRLGAVEVFKDGVIFTVQGWLGTKQFVTPWRDIASAITNGDVVMRSRIHSKATAVLPIEATYNAFILHLHILSKNEGSRS